MALSECGLVAKPTVTVIAVQQCWLGGKKASDFELFVSLRAPLIVSATVGYSDYKEAAAARNDWS